MSGLDVARFRKFRRRGRSLVESRPIVASLSVLSLAAGLLVAPAFGLASVSAAVADAAITFPVVDHEIEQSYMDVTGAHVYVTEPTISFYSYDEEEAPAGYPSYAVEIQITTAEDSPPVVQDSVEMVRDEGSSEAAWTVPVGALTFGNTYQLRYRLTADGEQGAWAGWFGLDITAPSASPLLVSPADGALALKPVALVAQIPDYIPTPGAFDRVIFTVEEGWQNGAPTAVAQLSGSITAGGLSTVSFAPPRNAGDYRWSAQWVGSGYSEPSEFRELLISEIAPPVYFLAATSSHLSAFLHWQVQSPVFAPVEYVDITITPGDISRRVLAPATSATVTDLALGDYVASITVTNALGTSAPVTTAFSVVPTAPPVPQSLAFELTGSMAHLTWAPPVNDGGSPVDHYRVDVRSYDGGTNVVVETSELFADIDLADGFSYRIFVYAVNGVGQGDGAFTAFSVYGVPSAPQNIEIRQGDGFANVFWDAPEHDGGLSTTKYRVHVSGVGTHTVTATYGRMGAQLDGIENGRTYTVTIRAVNEVGAGEPAKVKQVLGVSSAIDSDADGLPDVAEARFGSSSALADTDADGISDVDEALKLSAFLSPTLADTDGDGVVDADEDCDGDGIGNAAEILAGTNPASPDSDHDTVSDVDESTGGTNPLSADSDGDGVLDGAELALGLNPNVEDSNGDGTADSGESASQTIADVRQLRPQLSEFGDGYLDPASRLGGVSAAVTGSAGRLGDVVVTSSPAEGLVGSLTVVAEVFDHGALSNDTETMGPALARLDEGTNASADAPFASQLTFGYAEGVAPVRLQNLAPVRWNPTSYSWEFADNDVSVSTADHTISILSPDLGVRYAVVDLATWRAHVSECDSGATGRPQLDVEFVIDEMPSVLAGDSTNERFTAARSILDSLEPGDRASVREFGLTGIVFSIASGSSPGAWVFDNEIHVDQLQEEDLFGLDSLERARSRLDALEHTWMPPSPGDYPEGNIGWDPELALAPSVPGPSLEVNPYVKTAVPVECRKKVVVLITDGGKSGDLYNNWGTHDPDPDHPFSDAGVPVHVLDLGIGDPESSAWLQDMAGATDGSYSYVPTQGDLSRWIKDVAPTDWEAGDPNKDTDHDTIPDMVEIYGISSTLTERGGFVSSRFFSNPKRADSDRDGIPDNVEIGQRLDIGTQGAAWSMENINRNYWVVSDPSRKDGDLDGLDDRAEYDLQMNPLSADADGDGLDDGDEEMYGTFAQMYDTDSDEFSDAYETRHLEEGFDPLSYNEKISEYEWLAEAAIGFLCGEVDICSTNPTIPWLIGNLASGLLVFGDLRDGIALIAKGDYIPATLCAVGLIPGIGDAVGATSKITKFILKLASPIGLRAAPSAVTLGIGSIAHEGMHWRSAIQLLRQYTKTPKRFVKELMIINPDIVTSLRSIYKVSDKGITELVSKNGVFRFGLYAALKEADKEVRIITDYTIATRPRFLLSGKAGEHMLAKVVNLPKTFKQRLQRVEMPDGSFRARFWDGEYIDGDGVTRLFEAKVGYVSSGFAQAQVSKDVAWMVAHPDQVVEWHFFASKVTGMIGPSGHVLQMLKDAKITVVFHFPGEAI